LFALKTQMMRHEVPARLLPRGARRGALLLGVGFGLIMWVVLLSFWVNHSAIQKRLSRAEGLSVGIAELGADFDFYVHSNSVGFVAELNIAGTSAVPLSDTRLADFTSSGWRHRIENLPIAPSNWSISLNGLDIALGVAREETGGQPVGVLIIGTQPGEPDILMQDVRDALSARAEATGYDVLTAAEETGAYIVGSTLDTGQIALTTPALSGLHPDLILRGARAGHELNSVMSTPLIFDVAGSDHDLSNIGQLTTEDAQVLGCNASLAGCTAAGQTYVLEDQTLLSLNTNGPFSAFDTGTLTDLTVVGAAQMNELAVMEALIVDGSTTINTAAVLTTGDYAAMIVTQVFGSDVAGATTETSVSNVASATVLSTTTLRVENVSVGQGASRSPALSTPLFVSKTASFNNIITTGGCNGCK
jgi:hypothetical protein